MSGREWTAEEIATTSDCATLEPRSAAPASSQGTVGGLFPKAFEAYARIVHPAYKRVSEPTFTHGSEWVPVKWSDVASATGRIAHPAMEWQRVSTARESEATPAGGGQPWDRSPLTGSLPRDELTLVVELLSERVSADSECWYAFAEVTGLSVPTTSARISTPSGPAIVFRGSIDDAINTYQGQQPNYWGNTDLDWMVATEVDLMSTYVAGPTDCVSSIVVHPELEAWAIESTQGITSNADTVNSRNTI
ncbi:hypothetical protein J2S65_005174 [Rhodococcus fascians]|nr:hypothetical protein [Rhodococcus fascians]